MAYLVFSVTLLDGTYHGRRDGNEPEWPPAPLRLFQALVAAAAAYGRSSLPDGTAEALWWLAEQPPPRIIAPSHQVGEAHQTSVPNNAMDVVAAAWSRGNATSKDAQAATHKAMKTVRATYLDGDGRVWFVWPLGESERQHSEGRISNLQDLARRLVAVGWGQDLVAGHAEIMNEQDVDRLPGERWSPGQDRANLLRVPNADTLTALGDRHQAFLRRLDGGSLAPVPALSPTAYARISYRRDWEPAERPVAAFQLLKLDASGFRPFAARRSCVVAGMLRHATRRAAEQSGWPHETIDSFVLGHGESRGEQHEPVGAARFAYVPLPSLERRGNGGPPNVVGAVRRALLFVPAAGHQDEIEWARRHLSGVELFSEHDGDPQALLSLTRTKEKVAYRYIQPSSTWTTVTPVVLPGRDDRRRRKTERLLRKAIVQAGFSETLAAHADIAWRNVGFLPGADLASRYFVPAHLQHFPRCHARIIWRDPSGQPVKVPGPVVLGGGRYFGLGLFAGLADGTAR